ncbi:MAG: nitrogen fixation protein FixH [Burkholderiales bacterium]|jgi:hypothetical protein|nr:nitrogen fixation protein FixH [Burkholderiales bacterium]
MEPKNLQGRAWYREPMMWMVLGGPLLVVVASLITYVLIVRGSDPILERDPISEAQRVGKELTPEQIESMQPSIKARNHVASPSIQPDK